MKKILLINSAEEDVQQFIQPIHDTLIALEASVQIAQWREVPATYSPAYYDAIIISASPKGDNANFAERAQAFTWLTSVDVPVLGICAGHQLIGYIFGGELIRGEQSEDGMIPVHIEEAHPLFAGYEDGFVVEHRHNDAITLPEDFVLLASTPRCRVQAMRHATKPIFGVQWHVETTTLDIVHNFLSLIHAR